MLISSLFLHENICCGYSLEAAHIGASNEYSEHIFFLENYDEQANSMGNLCPPPNFYLRC